MAAKSKLIRYAKKAIKETDYTKINPKKWDWQQIIWPFRVMFHPFTGYEEMKYYKQGSMLLAALITVVWWVSGIFNFLEQGFLFNLNRIKNLSIFSIFMSTAMIVILWTISNWAICTLIDGEGRAKEIFISTAYAVMPLVLSIIPLALISKFLITEEGAFLSIANVIFFGWAIILLFIANTTVHNYSFLKSIVSMLLTIFGILVIMLLSVLVMSLFVQIWNFLSIIVNELFYRV